MSTPVEGFFKIFYSHELTPGAGKRVRSVRSRLNLTQKVMATKCAVSASLLSKVEEDERPLSAYLATKICASLPVNPLWLWTGEGSWGSMETETGLVKDHPYHVLKINTAGKQFRTGWEERFCAKVRDKAELINAAMEYYGVPPRQAVLPVIEEWLEEELGVSNKERLTY